MQRYCCMHWQLRFAVHHDGTQNAGSEHLGRRFAGGGMAHAAAGGGVNDEDLPLAKPRVALSGASPRRITGCGLSAPIAHAKGGAEFELSLSKSVVASARCGTGKIKG